MPNLAQLTGSSPAPPTSKPLVALLQALNDKCDCRPCATLREWSKELEADLSKK